MVDFSGQVALGESLTPVGQLRFTQTGPRQFSTFTYDQEWSDNPQAFAIDPALSLEGGPFHTSGKPGHMRDSLPGAFSDAAPDDWGRRLLERAYGNGLSEFEYLTLSDDMCRQGALRFLAADNAIIRGNTADAVPGIGPLASTALLAAAGSGRQFAKARDLAAWLGLVPREHSAGGKTKLLGISKRGNKYLRRMIVHGARSCVTHLDRSRDRLGPWLDGLESRMHKNKVTVALAAKIARIVWVILTKPGATYERRVPAFG